MLLEETGASTPDRTVMEVRRGAPSAGAASEASHMCRVSCYIQHMARGSSGRLVFEVDPALKRRLHAKLAEEGRTGKDWLVEQIQLYLSQPTQEPLPFARDGGRIDG